LLHFDFTKLLGRYKLPGVDFSAIVEREKKNIEALTRANKIAFEGWQALLRRQSEILQETMAETIANARKHDAIQMRADLAKQGFEKALDNMRELAEMAAKSQKEAFEVIRERIGENLDELRRFGKDE
jgi:phasin family protein